MPKTGPERQNFATMEELKHMYITENKSAREIARSIGCGETWVHNRLHEYGIPVRNQSEAMKLRTRTPEHAENIAQAHIGKGTFAGANNKKWKNGATLQNYAIRISPKYANFRASVLRFRGSKCEECGNDLLSPCPTCHVKLDRHVHHIIPFAENEELRYSKENVLVLCPQCHKKYSNTK